MDKAKKINIPDLDLASPGAVDSFQKGKWKTVVGGYEYVERFSSFNLWSLQVLGENFGGTATVTLGQSNFSPFGEVPDREGAPREGKSFDNFIDYVDSEDVEYTVTVPSSTYVEGENIFKAGYIKIKVATTEVTGKLLFELDQK